PFNASATDRRPSLNTREAINDERWHLRRFLQAVAVEQADVPREQFVHTALADQLDLVNVLLRAVAHREVASDHLHRLDHPPPLERHLVNRLQTAMLVEQQRDVE